MEQKKQELQLRPGATVFYDSCGWGLRRGDDVHYARGVPQTKILRQLYQEHRELETIITALGVGPGALSGSMAALAVAQFILEFEGFLEKE